MGGGGKGGNSGSQQSTQTSVPWGGQQPYLTYQYQQAQALPVQQPYPFPGYVPFSPTSVAAMEATQNRALQGSPLLPASQQQAFDTLGGQYLGAQPGLQHLMPGMSGQFLDVSRYPGAAQAARISDLGPAPGSEYQRRTAEGEYLTGGQGFEDAFAAARRAISPQVRGAFERTGRFGGGLSQEAETRALGDAFAGLYGQERGRQEAAARALDAGRASTVGQQLQAAGMLSGLYGGERGLQQQAAQQAAMQAAQQFGAERGRQMTATGMAPGLAAQDYADIGRLAQVGAMQEGKAGEALADAMSRFQFQQQAPYARLGAITPAISGGFPGGTTTLNQPLPQTSPLANALGGGMLGYWAGGPAGLTGLGLSPFGGAAIGAGLGLLGGK